MSRALITLVVLLVGVALGLGLARGSLVPSGQPVAAPASTPIPPALDTPAPAPPPDAPVSRTPAPADASEAVQRFLDAEARKDFAASFQLLRAADRAQFASEANWERQHADLPPVRAFELQQLERGNNRATAVGLLQLQPGLDPLLGLTPAQARARWVAQAEDGGWRVAFTESTWEPIYPPDDGASAAVQEWVATRQACQPAREYSFGLLGSPTVADALCGAQGPVEVGAPTALSEGGLDPAPYTSAFGADVEAWARVVPINAPGRLRAVVAPIGSEWTVVGVDGSAE